MATEEKELTFIRVECPPDVAARLRSGTLPSVWTGTGPHAVALRVVATIESPTVMLADYIREWYRAAREKIDLVEKQDFEGAAAARVRADAAWSKVAQMVSLPVTPVVSPPDDDRSRMNVTIPGGDAIKRLERRLAAYREVLYDLVLAGAAGDGDEASDVVLAAIKAFATKVDR